MSGATAEAVPLPDKAQVAELLHRSLTTIRYALAHRHAGVTIDDRTRVLAASLADAVHNLPAWLNGERWMDRMVRHDMATAIGLLNQLDAHLVTHHPRSAQSRPPVARRRPLLARWLGR